MKHLLPLARLLPFVPLAFAVGITLLIQALWIPYDPLNMFIPAVLWLALILGWAARQHGELRQQKRRGRKLTIERRELILPLCLAFLAVCSLTHLPMRVLLWTQQGTLRDAQNRPAFEQSFDGTLRPFKINHSHGGTRVFLWESRTMSEKTAFGFAHCPHDGCKGAQWGQYWDTSTGTPVLSYVPGEYYWDYDARGGDYISLGNDWYATTVTVEDVGD